LTKGNYWASPDGENYHNESIVVSIIHKEVFAEQLKSRGEDYSKTGQLNIIIIDGLDHVPREYQSVTNSFLMAHVSGSQSSFRSSSQLSSRFLAL
jgi:hypothetical protein